LFIFINFCLMSLFLINSKKNNSSTILNMRKIVESLIVSKFFFFSSFLCLSAFVVCDLVNWFVIQWRMISKRRLDA
jgi:hypothetical protein